jgi:hypothetical protein
MLLASFSYSATTPRSRASRLAAHSRGSTSGELGPDAMLLTTKASQASLASALQSLQQAASQHPAPLITPPISEFMNSGISACNDGPGQADMWQHYVRECQPNLDATHLAKLCML